MKTHIFILGAALCASGCSQNPDPRVSKLEARCAALETQNNALNKKVQYLGTQFTNVWEYALQLNGKASELHAFTELTASNLILLAKAMTLEPPTKVEYRYLPAPAQPVTKQAQGATKEGIPIDVYNRIVAEAARRYPINYKMQGWHIEDEVEAYKKLNPTR